MPSIIDKLPIGKTANIIMQNKQVVMTAFGMVVLQGCNFLATILIAAQLGPTDLGMFQLLISFCGISVLIGKLGLDEALSYIIPRQQVSLASCGRPIIFYALLIAGLVGLLIGGLGFLFKESISVNLFNNALIEAYMWVLLILIPLQLLLIVGLGALRGLDRTGLRAVAYYYIVGPVFLIVVALSAINELDIKEVFEAKILSIGMGLIFCFVFILYVTKGQGWVAQYKERKELHSFANWMIFVGIFQYMVDQPLIDLILIGYFDTSAQVGIYSVSAKLAGLLGQVQSAFLIVMAAKISRSEAVSNVELRNDLYLKSSMLIAHFTVIVSVLLYLWIDTILFMIGPEYIHGKQLFYILMTGYLVVGLLGLNSPLILSAGYRKEEFVFTGIALIVLVLGGYVMGSLFGASGVAVSTASAAIVLAIARKLFVSKKITNVSMPWLRKVFLISVTSFILCSILDLMLMSGSILSLIAVTFMFLASYALLLNINSILKRVAPG